MKEDVLRLDTQKEPSAFNDEMLIGAGLGAVLFSPIIGTAIGAAIGSYIGHRRMKYELENGKEIKEPTIFNKSFAMGALAPLAIAALVIPAIIGLGGGTEGLIESFKQLDTAFETTKGLSQMPGSLAAIALTSIGAALTTPITAGIGAFLGKKEMRQEKAMAQEQQRKQELAHQRQRDVQLELKPEQFVGRRQKYTKMIDEQRSQTALQGQSK